MDDIQEKRLESILRHITHVRDNCEHLGKILIEKGEENLGIGLIKNGIIHDASKFTGIEWLYLHQDIKDKEPEKFELAVQTHQETNPHHPEFWHGIENTPRIYLAEFVCDTQARSSEFGTDYRDWIKDYATKRYKFKTNGRIYKEIKEFIDFLLDPAFK